MWYIYTYIYILPCRDVCSIYIFLGLFSAICLYTREYMEDFTESTGYGCLGDFVCIINHGNTQFGNGCQ